MEEKPNKVNTFWTAYYDAALASGKGTRLEYLTIFLREED